jgi:hypothetical protein
MHPHAEQATLNRACQPTDASALSKQRMQSVSLPKELTGDSQSSRGFACAWRAVKQQVRQLREQQSHQEISAVQAWEPPLAPPPLSLTSLPPFL